MQNRRFPLKSSAVSNWLLLGVLMLLVQVILGGITRLTGSGLSITEWDVVTGALPPLNEDQWIDKFEKYRQTPQYHLLNTGFTLHDFKFIFFWEWFHRFWARLVGVVFLAGLGWLLLRKKMNPSMVRPLLILFLLGALQGAVGWIMVASGLTGDAIYVKPVNLALHFVFAMGLICYTFWFYLELAVPADQIMHAGRTRTLNWAILIILVLQLIYGALMAGYKAANVAPTWPTINGDWFPAALSDNQHLNLISNKIVVHFIHRGLAYILLLLVIIWTMQAGRIPHSSRLAKSARRLPALLICLQIILGIAAVLTSPGIAANHWVLFDWLAQFHQITGMLFLLSMVLMLFLFRPARASV